MKEENTTAAVILLILTGLFCSHFLWVGLERDEGWYLLVTSKIIDGWLPYRDILADKPLGLDFTLLPFVILGGRSVVAIRCLTAIIIAFTSYITYLIGKRIMGFWCGLAAGLFSVILSFSPLLQAYTVKPVTLVNLVSALILLILFSSESTGKRNFLLGLLAGYAASIHQLSVWMIIPIIVGIYLQEKQESRFKSISIFSIGFLFIGVIILTYLIWQGIWTDAYYHMVLRNLEPYIPLGLDDRLDVYNRVFNGIYAVLFLSLVGLAYAPKYARLILVLWVISPLVAINVGPTFYPHHFKVFIPSLSILSGVGLVNLTRFFKELNKKLNNLDNHLNLTFIGVFLIVLDLIINLLNMGDVGGFGRIDKLVILLGISIIIYKRFMGFEGPSSLRIFYVILAAYLLLGLIPLTKIQEIKESGQAYENTLSYSETASVVSFLQSNTPKNDTIYVFPYEPQIYYLSGVDPIRPAEFVIKEFFIQASSKEFERVYITPIKNNKPKFIIFFRNNHYWDLVESSNGQRFLDFINQQYQVRFYLGRITILERKSFSD